MEIEAKSPKANRKGNQRFTANQDKLAILVKSRLKSDQLLSDLLSYYQAPKKAYEYLNKLLKLSEEMSEDQILKLIEPSNKDPKAMIKIRSLVNKVLLDSLFLINYDQPNIPDIWEKEYECMKLLFQAKVLIRDGARNNAIHAIERLIKIAEEYSFTALLVEGYTLLRNHYSLLGKTSTAHELREKVSKLHQILIAEFEMQNLVTEVQASINSSTKSRALFKSRFTLIVEEAKTILTSCSSPQLVNHYFIISSNYYYYEERFDNVIQLCNEIEEKINSSSKYNKIIKFNEIAIFKANALMRTGKYNEAERYIKNSLHHFSTGSPKWIKFQEELFINAMYLDDFSLALEVLRTVAPWRKEAKMPEAIKEKWMIYVLFLSLVHELPPHYFFIKNFLTKKVQLTQDKLGFNVIIQLIQIIKMIEKQELELAYLQVQALNKARIRVKIAPENKRLAILVQSLAKLLQNPFNQFKIIDLSNKVIDKLQSTPPLNEYYSEFEVLPYEKLWKVVTKILERLQISKKTSLLVSKKGS